MKNKYLLTVCCAVVALAGSLIGLVSYGGQPAAAIGKDVILSVGIDEIQYSLSVNSPAAGGQVNDSFSLDISGSNILQVEVFVDLDDDGVYSSDESLGILAVDQDGDFGPQFIVGPVTMPISVDSGNYNMKVIGWQKLQGGGGTREVIVPLVYTQSTALIDKITPDFGTVDGGTNIEIIGENFRDGSKVYIGGNECLNTVVVSSSKITCTTPAGSAGAAAVTIIGSNGTVSKVGGFLYISGGSGGSIVGLPNVPNTGLFRVGNAVVMTSDIIIVGLAALVILLSIVLLGETKHCQKLAKSSAAKKSTKTSKSNKSTPAKRVRSKKYKK